MEETYSRAVSVVRKIWTADRLRAKGKRDLVLAEQRKNLQMLLEYALRRCPYYAERFRGNDPNHPRLEDFAPTDKVDLMKNFERVVTDPSVTYEDIAKFVNDPRRVGELYKGRYVASHTSGSSGVRGIFVIDKWGWEMSQALSLAGGEIPPFGRGWFNVVASSVIPVRAATVIPTLGHYSSMLMPFIRPNLSKHFVEMKFIEITDPFDKIVAQLNDYKPFALHSYPSMLDVLSRYKERGELKIRPYLVTAGGEPFPEDIIRHVRRAWPGVPIYDIYACTETLGISKTCGQGTYHVNEDWIIIENVDASGAPVPIGKRGDKIYMTCLFNYLMPLIRYEITDSVIFDDAPCACGQPTIAVKILGRTNHTLQLPGADGKEVMILPTPLLVAFMDVPGLRQYQIVQQARDHLHINFVPEDGQLIEDLRRGVEHLLDYYLNKHRVAPSVRRTYEHVPLIPRDPRTHKIMQIINKVDAPASSTDFV